MTHLAQADLTPTTTNLPEPLTSKTATPWNFWKLATHEGWYLYAEQGEEVLHLGAFSNLSHLVVQQVRFLENRKTTVVLPLKATDFHAWLAAPTEHPAPRFIGQLGSAWSGYGIKPLEENATQVEVIYAADLRHEWMGVFSEAEAFEIIEQHYDRRRQRCLIC